MPHGMPCSVFEHIAWGEEGSRLRLRVPDLTSYDKEGNLEVPNFWGNLSQTALPFFERNCATAYNLE